MKKSKVIFILIVSIIAGLGLWFGFLKLGPPPPPPPLPSSPMVSYYENRIDSIRNYSSSTFCVKLFAETYAHLDNCRADNNFGFEENDRIYSRLRSDLCSAYSLKFIEQSYQVIDGTVWNKADLSIIKEELNHLSVIGAFDPGSIVSSGVLNIQRVVTEYFQVQNFIATCNSYNFPSSSVNSINTPIIVPSFYSNDYSNIVSMAGSSPLSNCPYLTSDLESAKLNLFNEHNKSLKVKIENFANLPVPYSMQSYVLSHSDWSSYIYQPLRDDLDLFDSNPYNLSDITSEVNALDQLLSDKNSSAAYYFP